MARWYRVWCDVENGANPGVPMCGIDVYDDGERVSYTARAREPFLALAEQCQVLADQVAVQGVLW